VSSIRIVLFPLVRTVCCALLTLCFWQIERARKYYARARRGIRMLAPESRLPVQASLDCYSQILDKIELNNYDNFKLRAYVSKEEKMMTIPASWYRTTDFSQMLPLWGEQPVKKME